MRSLDVKGHQTTVTMTAAYALIGNGTWSTIINNPRKDCLRRSLGTLSVKGSQAARRSPRARRLDRSGDGCLDRRGG